MISNTILLDKAILNCSGRSSIHGTPTHSGGGIMAPGNLNQTSHVLDQTATHLIEEYGSTLPVVVTEILTISESKIDIRLSFKSNIMAV